MRIQIQELVLEEVRQYVNQHRSGADCERVERKKQSHARRGAEIVKAQAEGRIIDTKATEENQEVFYSVHFRYLIKQKELMYIEEELEHRKAVFNHDALIEDVELKPGSSSVNYSPLHFPNGSDAQSHSAIDICQSVEAFGANEPFITIRTNNVHRLDSAYTSEKPQVSEEERLSYRYNRHKAVQYAEKWWNSYNPAYRKFENDCTNFISQCLHQGGAPMRGHPNRSKGWWMRGQNYSYSWAMANSLKGYLANSKIGLRAREVAAPEQLLLGDVICYDFQGDGRFDHNTIVTGKDANGMPLVNAHTYNSRQRYWAYEDSSAYTPNIKYKLLTIVDDN